jgi:hypothetical protein
MFIDKGGGKICRLGVVHGLFTASDRRNAKLCWERGGVLV